MAALGAILFLLSFMGLCILIYRAYEVRSDKMTELTARVAELERQAELDKTETTPKTTE